jgi:hypothetical protein
VPPMLGDKLFVVKWLILGDRKVLNASQPFTVCMILTSRGITLSPGWSWGVGDNQIWPRLLYRWHIDWNFGRFWPKWVKICQNLSCNPYKTKNFGRFSWNSGKSLNEIRKVSQFSKRVGRKHWLSVTLN